MSDPLPTRPTDAGAEPGAGDSSATAAAALPAPPAVVLVEPQLGENIGTAARAMANFGWRDLRLVKPRDGWPSDKARAAASRADHVIDGARVYGTLDEAIADLTFVIATTRRQRDMMKPVLGPEAGLTRLVRETREGGSAGVLFGRERTGLENDEVALADVIVTFPVDPTFASLNVAQSVLMMAYEWRRQVTDAALPFAAPERAPPATRGELTGLWRALVDALEPTGYFRPPHMRERMAENLLLVLEDARWDAAQVKALRGVVAHLARGPLADRTDRGD